MQKLVIGALLLSALSECVLVSDMSEKVFLFPVTSATAYVSLIPQMKKPLENFTLCMKAFSDLTRPYSLFSYSTYTKENEVLLFVNSAEEYMFYVGNEGVTFRVPPKPYDPVHICVKWESESGIVEFWMNGKPVGRKGLKKGYVVGSESKIILGQEQDSFGGRFDAAQSMVGEIWEVSLWDHVFPLEEMPGPCESGNIINWQNLTYEKNGYVVIKPELWD